MVHPHRTLALTTTASTLTLIAFVAPQATATRTAATFTAGPAVLAWLLAAMPLALAVALLPAGAAGDDHGRRRVFTTGLVLLGLGALVCAAAPGPGLFITGRLIQGAGAAGVLACGLGLIATTYPPGPERLRASGAWGASIGGGIAVGGLLPVLVDAGGGWRVSYAVLAAASMVLAVVAARLLANADGDPPVVPGADKAAGAPGTGPKRASGTDLWGVVTLGAAVACALAAVVQIRIATGTGAGSTGLAVLVVLLVAAALITVAFVVVERRTARPMLDLSLFRRRAFLAATAAALANGAGGTALVSYLPTLVQAGLGRSLLVASLLTALFAGTSVATALQARRLAAVAPTWVLMAAALGVLAGAQLALAGLEVGSGVARLLPGLVVGGVAYGVLNAALGAAAVASVPPGRASVGSGANNTARYLASAVGVTVVALLAPAAGAGGDEAARAALVGGWSAAAVVTAVVSLAGAAVVALLRPARGVGQLTR